MPEFDPDKYLKQDKITAITAKSDNFDPNAYLSKSNTVDSTDLAVNSFNPDKYLNKQAEPVSNITDSVKAGALGVGEGLSAGFLDNIAGGVLGSIDYLTSRMLKASLSPEEQRFMDTPEFSTAYADAKKDVRKEIDEAQRKNGKAFLAGELAGGAAGPGSLTVGLSKKLASKMLPLLKPTSETVIKAGKQAFDLYNKMPPELQRVVKVGAWASSPAHMISLYGLRKLGKPLLNKLEKTMVKGGAEAEALTKLLNKGEPSQNIAKKLIEFTD